MSFLFSFKQFREVFESKVSKVSTSSLQQANPRTRKQHFLEANLLIKKEELDLFACLLSSSQVKAPDYISNNNNQKSKMGNCGNRQAAQVNAENLGPAVAANQHQVQPLDLKKSSGLHQNLDQVPTNGSGGGAGENLAADIKVDPVSDLKKKEEPAKGLKNGKGKKRTTLRSKKSKGSMKGTKDSFFSKNNKEDDEFEDEEEEMEDELGDDDPETLKDQKEMQKTIPNKMHPSPDVAPGTPSKVLNLEQQEAITESFKTDTEFNSLKEEVANQPANLHKSSTLVSPKMESLKIGRPKIQTQLTKMQQSIIQQEAARVIPEENEDDDSKIDSQSKIEVYSGMPALEKKQTNQIIEPTLKFQQQDAAKRAAEKFKSLNNQPPPTSQQPSHTLFNILEQETNQMSVQDTIQTGQAHGSINPSQNEQPLYVMETPKNQALNGPALADQTLKSADDGAVGEIRKEYGIYKNTNRNDQPFIYQSEQRLIEKVALRNELEKQMKEEQEQMALNYRRPQIIDLKKVAQDTLPPKPQPVMQQFHQQQSEEIVLEADEYKSLLLANLKVADTNELNRLFTLTKEQCIIRNNNLLQFNIPMPFTQTKQTRTVSPLYIAVATGSLPNVKLILKELQNIDLELGIELKIKPSLEHQYDKMIGIHQKGPPIVIKRRSPLQLACALGFYKIADQLLEAGAKPDGLDLSEQAQNVEIGEPPILLTIRKKFRKVMIMEEISDIELWHVFDRNQDIDYIQTFKILIQRGVNPEKDLSSWYPKKPTLIFHCLKNAQLVQILHFNNIQVDLTVLNQKSQTPLYFLCKRVSKECRVIQAQAEQQHVDPEQVIAQIIDQELLVAQLLVEKLGAQVKYCQPNPFIAALQSKKFLIAQYLAEQGGDINVEDDSRELSAIHIIVQHSREDVLEQLLKFPQLNEVNYGFKTDEEGKNLMHLIAETSNPGIFAVFQASRFYDKDLVRELLNQPLQGQGSETFPIFLAYQSIELCRYLLLAGTDLSPISFHECFQLYKNKSQEFLSFLIQEANMSPDELDQNQKTPFLIAADQQDYQLAEFLLANSSQVDVRFNEDYRKGMTVLHQACLFGDIKMATICLKAGADLNLKCWRGRTCLDLVKITYKGKTEEMQEHLRALLYRYMVKNKLNPQMQVAKEAEIVLQQPVINNQI